MVSFNDRVHTFLLLNYNLKFYLYYQLLTGQQNEHSSKANTLSGKNVNQTHLFLSDGKQTEKQTTSKVYNSIRFSCCSFHAFMPLYCKQHFFLVIFANNLCSLSFSFFFSTLVRVMMSIRKQTR